MNILFIASWYPSPARPHVGVFTREWARCVSLNHDVVVITWEGIDAAARSPFEIEDAIEAGIRTLRIRYPRPLVPKTTFFRLLGALRAAVDGLVSSGWRPDIIHAHVYSSAFLSVLIGRLRGIPVVVTEHYSGFALGRVRGFERLKALFAFNNAALVLPVSESQRATLASFGVRSRMVPVPNPVDAALFHPTEQSGAPSGVARLLFVGLLTPIKGVDVLLDASAQLARENVPFELTIVGDGPERKSLEAQAEALGLDRMVRFSGYQQREMVAAAMRESDVFVLPSRWETFSCVVTEALMSGLPVVATRVGGLPELVDSASGWLVSPESPSELATAVRGAIESVDTLDRTGIATRARDRFSYEAVGARLNALYTELVEGGGARGRR